MCIVHAGDVGKPVIFRCAQTGCRACLEGLMEWHDGLVHAVLRKQSSGPLSYAETLQAGRIGLWQAVLHFDPGRGAAFSSYAGVAIERKIWQVVAQAQRPQGWLEPEEPVDALEIAEDRLSWSEVCTALATAIARLPGRQREVIQAVCGWDGEGARDLTQVGQQWGVSRQAAAYWYYKALVSLRLPAVSGRLRQLWDQDSREGYGRSQVLSRAWLRQRRGRRVR